MHRLGDQNQPEVSLGPEDPRPGWQVRVSACSLSVWLLEHPYYVAASLLLSKKPKRPGGSCKASHTLVLEVTHGHRHRGRAASRSVWPHSLEEELDSTLCKDVYQRICGYSKTTLHEKTISSSITCSLKHSGAKPHFLSSQSCPFFLFFSLISCHFPTSRPPARTCQWLPHSCTLLRLLLLPDLLSLPLGPRWHALHPLSPSSRVISDLLPSSYLGPSTLLPPRGTLPTLGLRCQELGQGRDVWCPLLGPYSQNGAQHRGDAQETCKIKSHG